MPTRLSELIEVHDDGYLRYFEHVSTKVSGVKMRKLEIEVDFAGNTCWMLEMTLTYLGTYTAYISNLSRYILLSLLNPKLVRASLLHLTAMDK